MTSILIDTFTELPGAGRLGRHREHDERSRLFAVAEDVAAVKTVVWTRRAPIFDQGNLGSCTGNAMAGAVGTDSAGRTGNAMMHEDDAVGLYELATRLDHFPGVYPPDDTGSSGLAVAKAAKRGGFITGYRHAFSLHAALTALQSGPCIVGMAWLTGCDSPDPSGLVRYEGDVRGGHEIELIGCDVDAQTVTFANSWGEGWGAAGYFSMSLGDFHTALKDGGDVTVPVF
jgi:hypothetical protein